MYKAIIQDYLGADYTFSSYSFKWVFYTSVHFAKQALYLRDWLFCIVIEFSNGLTLAVSRTRMAYVFNDERVYEYTKEA